MITVLVGTNRFALKQVLDELIDAFVKEHGDLALERIDASEASYDSILGALEAMPFLSTHRMVVLSDLSANKQATDELGDLLGRVSEATELIRS